MKIGLTGSDLNSLRTLFRNYKNIERVILYGSRAKGNFKKFSDIDITLLGNGLDNSVLNNLIVSIDDLLLPYNFDVSIYSSLSNSKLREHINRTGITIYDHRNS